MFRPKCVYNYKNKNYIITMGRQNVTSESTPSGPLSSKVLHATTYGLSNGTERYHMSDEPNEVSIPFQAHNHANLQETEKLHLENKATLNFEY